MFAVGGKVDSQERTELQLFEHAGIEGKAEKRRNMVSLRLSGPRDSVDTHPMYSTLLHLMKTSPKAPFDFPFSISSVFANYHVSP